MYRVFVENNNPSILQMFRENGWTQAVSLEDSDLVCFQGGADVTPALYGEHNTASYNNPDTDWQSLILFNNALRLRKPMVGICRGGQFLNVMAGGKMVQDYPDHAIRDTHVMTTNEGTKVQVTSTHHQVMVLGPNSFLLGYGPGGEHEVEVCFHQSHLTPMLSYQPHPEYVEFGHECVNHFFYTIQLYFSMA